jgi:hypothetical protein
VSQGGFIGLNTAAGLTFTISSLSNFSLTKMSAGLQPDSSIGSFTFSDLFKTSLKHGQQFPAALSFIILNANVGQITGLWVMMVAPALARHYGPQLARCCS